MKYVKFEYNGNVEISMVLHIRQNKNYNLITVFVQKGFEILLDDQDKERFLEWFNSSSMSVFDIDTLEDPCFTWR